MFPNDIPHSSIRELFRMIFPSFVMLEWFPVSSHARKVLTPLTKYHRHQISEVSKFSHINHNKCSKEKNMFCCNGVITTIKYCLLC